MIIQQDIGHITTTRDQSHCWIAIVPDIFGYLDSKLTSLPSPIMII